MKKRGYGILITALFIISIPVFSQKNEKILSLDECIVRALENNLRLAVEVLNPEMADLNVARAGERFLPELSFGYSNRDTNTASYSFIDAADQVRSSYTDYLVSFNQLIPTGGEFNISLSSYKNDTNRSFQTINPRYGSTLTFDFVQPLLKNFGLRASRREIILAENNRDMTEKQFRQTLLDTIYQVERAYWNLAYSIDNLRVQKQSLQLALDLLEENKRKIEVGTMPPIEIYTSEAEVANRRAEILAAEALVKNNQDRLKRIINIPLAEGEEQVDVVPSDKPAFEKREIRFREALDTAMAKRPDLESLRVNVKTQKFNVKYAGNQLLPELNLRASYWSPGISGDQIEYLDDNPFTRVVVGTVPGPASDALKDAFKFKYQNWSVGLVLNIPLNSILSRAEHARAKLALEQAQWRLKDLEQEVILEIRAAMRNVETNYQRVQAYRAARELAEKKLEAEQEKFRVGKSTNFFLLQFQRDAADARSAELRSLVDYVLSTADLDRVLGTTFETKNITFSGINIDPEQ